MKERIEKLELITDRLMRRSRKVAKAIITPFPISSCVKEENIKGDVLHYMFPGDGVITKGIIRFNGLKLKDGIKVTIKLENSLGSNIKQFIVEKPLFKISPNIGILSGDCLTISAETVNQEAALTELWAAFLWVPHISETNIKNCLINELESTRDRLLTEK